MDQKPFLRYSGINSSLPVRVSATDFRNNTKLYLRRWAILALYLSTYLSSLSIQLIFSTDATTFTKYYGTSTFAINSLSIVFSIVEIPLILPSAFLLSKIGLRTCLSIAVILQFLGAWIRYTASSPDRFGLLFFGQTIVAIAQPLLDAAPTKLTGQWFGESERTTASGFFVITNAIVIAATFLGGSQLIQKVSLSNILFAQAVGTTVIAVLVLVFFEEKPPIPPTKSAGAKRLDKFGDGLLSVWKAKGWYVLLFLFAFAIGFSQSFYAVWEEIITKYKYTPGESGISVTVITISGIVGAFTLSFLVDKTKYYKLFLYIASIGSFVLSLAIALWVIFGPKNIWVFYGLSAIYGFFSWASSGILMEVTAVVTHPVPEETTIAVLLVFGDLLSVASGYILTGLLKYGAALTLWVFAGSLALPPIALLFFHPDYKKSQLDKE